MYSFRQVSVFIVGFGFFIQDCVGYAVQHCHCITPLQTCYNLVCISFLQACTTLFLFKVYYKCKVT